MALQIGSLTSGSALPSGWFSVKDYGAVGDNSHDDTTAIQAAVSAIKASYGAISGSSGATLYFPPGYYKTTAKLDLTLLPEVRILGGSGRGPSGRASIDANPPCTINYTGGGSGIAVDLGGSSSCVWDGVSVVAATTLFTGILVNFDARSHTDVFGNRIQNCYFTNATNGGGTLLTLDGHIELSVENVWFGGVGSGGTQVRGANPSTGNAGWFNANSFKSCSFIGTRQYSFTNPGSQVGFYDCTFEPSGNSPAPVAALAVTVSAQNGVSFHQCGWWDVTTTGGAWVKSTVATGAWGFFGCYLEGSTDGPMFSFSAMNGLAVHGCSFQSSGTPAPLPVIFDPAYTITNGSFLGNNVRSNITDNHTTVFV